ncbi:MAG: hypothetical protein JJE09_10460 [Bacteroidia bacterium]|nr:hypothetical protein [Bacteroidia bacterium]
MTRLLLSFFLIGILLGSANAQIKYSILVIESNKTFDFSGSDVLAADTLIMKDSSTIKLNYLKDDNYIHCKKLVVGKGCKIIGRGENGRQGKDGGNGYSLEGPCHDGTIGRNGSRGVDGINGNNLFLYTDEIIFNGNLFIGLSGGNAGDGGDGGDGGGGSSGTRICPGGNGGNGGNGAPGGIGGNSGNLTLRCNKCPDLRNELNQKLIVRVYGGLGGLGGEGGSPGLPGILVNGTSKQDGKHGTKGKNGADGIPGRNGAITF